MPTDNSQFNILESLPEEVTIGILDKLNPSEIATTSQVSKHLKRLSQDNTLWQHRYQAFFGKKLPDGYNTFSRRAFKQKSSEVRAIILDDRVLSNPDKAIILDDRVLSNPDKAIMCQWLLSGQTDNSTSLTHQYIALHVLAKAGFLLGVNQLLKIEHIKQKVGIRFYSYYTPIRCAAENGHNDVVNRLLEIDAVKRYSRYELCFALKLAAIKGDLDVVNRLLGIDFVKDNYAAITKNVLLFTVGRGHLNVVNRLLEIEAISTRANEKDNATLRKAAQRGHPKIVNRLLELDSVRLLVLETQEQYSEDIVQKAQALQATLNLNSPITPSFERVRDDEDDRPDENTDNRQHPRRKRFCQIS